VLRLHHHPQHYRPVGPKEAKVKEPVAFLSTSVGRFVRDLVEGAIAGAIAAVVALQLDVATPQVILVAAVTGAIAAIIAVARRAIVNAVSPAAPGQP
jgi:hypothetical protein